MSASMKTSRWLSMACMASLLACGGTMKSGLVKTAPHLADVTGPLAVDLEASEVRVDAMQALGLDPAGLRLEIADSLTEASGGKSGGKPARVRVSIRGERSGAMLAPCLIVLFTVGCPGMIDSLEMDVELEGPRGRIKRHASDWWFLSPYYFRNMHEGIGRLLGQIIAEAGSSKGGQP
jgi:hypothetical protein